MKKLPKRQAMIIANPANLVIINWKVNIQNLDNFLSCRNIIQVYIKTKLKYNYVFASILKFWVNRLPTGFKFGRNF